MMYMMLPHTSSFFLKKFGRDYYQAPIKSEVALQTLFSFINSPITYVTPFRNIFLNGPHVLPHVKF